MKGIKQFEEFIDEGIVKKQNPDISRATFLIEEVENSFEALKETLEKIGTNDRNANSIVKQCYDILMELVRAKMLTQGYNSTGRGAHEAEVSFLRMMHVPEQDVQFANQMRYFRNGITYYGRILDKKYADKVIRFTKRIYPLLKRTVDTPTN
ncbi:MAG: hypothetical protein ABIA93_06370 [Candidatus Woesearchaeota archaeon]